MESSTGIPGGNRSASSCTILTSSWTTRSAGSVGSTLFCIVGRPRSEEGRGRPRWITDERSRRSRWSLASCSAKRRASRSAASSSIGTASSSSSSSTPSGGANWYPPFGAGREDRALLTRAVSITPALRWKASRRCGVGCGIPVAGVAPIPRKDAVPEDTPIRAAAAAARGLGVASTLCAGVMPEKSDPEMSRSSPPRSGVCPCCSLASACASIITLLPPAPWTASPPPDVTLDPDAPGAGVPRGVANAMAGVE
mmetsp:Transcript_6460/g.17867  ORF Transcript_6460/g.17867 Transcript_6460/m.17867 type:complete len:254 (-) Transcript_6460:3433-4194(-)